MTTKVTKSGVGAIDQLSTGSVKHSSSPVNNITLDANGRVGIGASSPSRKLHISDSGVTCGIRIDNTVSGRPALLLYDDSQNLTLINSSDTGYFAFVNGTGAGTERMRIDSAGRVTKPYQPAFCAAVDGGSANATITNYYLVRENIGNHFNATTGTFTAPIAGTYFFFANIMSGGASYHWFQFRRNGSDIGSYHHTHSNLPTYRHSSGSTIATLAANDAVTIYLANGSPYSSGPNPWSLFGGYLIG